MRKNLRAILFSVGISIQLLAFLGDRADELPFLERTVTPSYYRAKKCLDKLVEGQTVGRLTDGFSQLSKIMLPQVREALRAEGHFSTNDMAETIIDTAHMDPEFAFGDKPVETLAALDVFTRNPGLMKYNVSLGGITVSNAYFLDQLKSEVEELKGHNILIFCFAVFILGTVLDVIAFRMGSKEDDKMEERHRQLEERVNAAEAEKIAEKERLQKELEAIDRLNYQ